jgi:Fe-Mn family superoxide dismutase
MTLKLAPLPYDLSALEPHVSARTLTFHHGKHHKAYVDNTNAATKGNALQDADLDTIVRTAKAKSDRRLFNNSAQVWNHDFFWQSMTPVYAPPSGNLLKLIQRDFGGFDELKKAFKAEAVGHFASGWAWLVRRDGKLQVTSYHDADTPLVHPGVEPLLTADVWEHAYYLDYCNARGDFIDAFLDKLANWKGVAARLDAAS